MSWRKWRRGPLATLTVCVLLSSGAVACSTGEAHGDTVSPSPVGKVLDVTDETGRNLREVPRKDAPEVAVEVAPDAGGGWDVRLAFHNFRCSAPGTRPAAAIGRGLAHLFVDGHRIARLHAPAYHLAAGLVPHGTHRITVRLYADDGTVWAVRGKPVENTADVTVSDVETRTARSAAADPVAQEPVAQEPVA
ncbi:hypothetical protein GT045_36950 [Streptomyces sp. SID486]|uniref:hypothetical protein n=1 Tax=Streptomyces sp. SID486 TaxID=2690264 RepID=UPI00136A77E9|nr:hypothetical protein [Streptomyces sp. SID486]MYY00230.1 hypothetical protein [Streptomyces sp. SID486]